MNWSLTPAAIGYRFGECDRIQICLPYSSGSLPICATKCSAHGGDPWEKLGRSIEIADYQ
ncbi:MAG: hypothetical protein AAF808_14245 [Cyanobacteria bacterium P01_D01_bin.2]